MTPPPRWLPGADAVADTPRERPDGDHLHRHRSDPDQAEAPFGASLPDLPLPYALDLSAGLLREAGGELRRLQTRHRIAAIARIARSWTDPHDALRAEAVERVASETGLTEVSVAWGLDAAWEVVTRAALERWWSRSGGAVGSGLRLTGHIWAGNVFVAGLPPVLASLLAGVPALIKAPGRLPTFAALFARSVAEHAPELGPCVGAAAWGRADGAATNALMRGVDHLYAFGDDDSMDELRALQPEGAGFSGFGDRYSIGLAAPDLGDEALAGFALDALAYDGAGCLTPKWVFVPGDAPAAEALARRAAPILEAAAQELPALPLTAGPGARRSAWLGVAAFGGWEAHGPGWAVASLPAGAPLSDPPPRTLCFVPVRPGELPARLAPLGPRLQGIASLSLPASLRPALTALGLALVTPPGSLQRPPLDWVHDDVDSLAVLCRA